MQWLIIAFIVMIITNSEPVPAAELQLSGSLGVESKWFPKSPQFASQLDHYQPSVILDTEFRWQFDRKHQITLIPFVDLDGQDHERTHFDLREAYWRHIGDKWDVLVGLNKVYWG